jgi:hypothetical protein
VNGLSSLRLVAADRNLRPDTTGRRAESRHVLSFGIGKSTLSGFFSAIYGWFTNCTLPRHELGHMTLRIEQSSRRGRTVLKLIGQIHSEDLEDFKAQTLGAGPGMEFDLDELTLVDVWVVRYLAECEARGVDLLKCPPYIREWIKRETNRK